MEKMAKPMCGPNIWLVEYILHKINRFDDKEILYWYVYNQVVSKAEQWELCDTFQLFNTINTFKKL